MAYVFFFFNDTATTEIYTLSLHDALPISDLARGQQHVAEIVKAVQDNPTTWANTAIVVTYDENGGRWDHVSRSEEHTSELQSHLNLVCRLLLEKKKKIVS